MNRVPMAEEHMVRLIDMILETAFDKDPMKITYHDLAEHIVEVLKDGRVHFDENEISYEQEMKV